MGKRKQLKKGVAAVKNSSTRRRPTSSLRKGTAASRKSLPRLKWGSMGWEGKITLVAWRGYQMKSWLHNAVPGRKKSSEEIELVIPTPDDERVPPSLEQSQAFALLIKEQAAIRDVILKAVMKAYAKLRVLAKDLGDDSFLGELHLPKRFTLSEQLKSHIRLSTVYVLPSAKRGVAYVGYAFDCTWDVEHGLGVVMHGKRVLDVGESEVAFMETDLQDDLGSGKKAAGGLRAKLDVNDLISAVQVRDPRWVQALLDAGAIPEKRYLGPRTVSAIEWAVGDGEAEILKILLKAKKRPLNPDLLMRAGRLGHLDVFKLLVAEGLQPNEKHLTNAVTYRQAPIVRFLLKLGVRPNKDAVRRAAGIVPRSLAGVPQNIDRPMLRMLKQAGAEAPDAQTAKIFNSL